MVFGLLPPQVLDANTCTIRLLIIGCLTPYMYNAEIVYFIPLLFYKFWPLTLRVLYFRVKTVHKEWLLYTAEGWILWWIILLIIENSLFYSNLMRYANAIRPYIHLSGRRSLTSLSKAVETRWPSVPNPERFSTPCLFNVDFFPLSFRSDSNHDVTKCPSNQLVWPSFLFLILKSFS